MNKQGVKLFFILFLFSLIGGKAAAQARFIDKYIFWELNLENGLPCNYVDDALVDDSGFLWIGTSGGGLCRYDGYDLLIINSSTSQHLSSIFIRSMALDKFQRLWVASDGGLDIIDTRTLEKVDILSALQNEQLCSFVTVDSNGAVWTKFGTTIYHIAFDRDGNIDAVRSFSNPGLDSVSHIFKDVDRDGSVWTRIGDGLYKLELFGDDGLSAFPLFPSLKLGEGTYVSDFLRAEASIWISTEDGLYRVFRETGDWKLYQSSVSDPNSLTQNFVSSLAVTPDGSILASTLHGLNVYNPVTDGFERVGNDVINFVKSSGNNLLIATETEGLKFASQKSLFVKNYTLAPGAVNAIWQEESGRLWVGSVEGGLSIRDVSGSVQHLTSEKNGLSHNSVSAVRPGRVGEMYVGTWGEGINIVSTDQKPRVLSNIITPDGLIDYIGVLEYDKSNGILWIGSNRGVFTYNPFTRSMTPVLEEQVSGCIGSCIDSSNHLWMGCLEGLLVFDLSKDGFPYVHYRYKLDRPETRVKEKVSFVMEYSPGEMYIGSNGGGFYKAVLTADGDYSFKSYSILDGLSSDRVRGMCKDEKGMIWISTEYGLNLFNPKTEVITSFGEKDGLASARFHWNNSCQGTDGNLYFGHAKGYSVIDPSRFSADNGKKAFVRFTRVSVGERNDYNPFIDKITMREGEGALLIQFAALMPDASSNVHYEYVLGGFDKKWHRLSGDRREVNYSALPYGKYNFVVKAFDRYGSEIDSLSIVVRVKPKFVHTIWFAVMVGIFMVALVLALFSWRVNAMRRRELTLEHTVEERTREISAQKKLVEEKADELRRQNEVLMHQNEELASRKMLSSRGDDPFVDKAINTLRSVYKDPNLDVDGFCKAIGMSKTLLNNKLQEAFGQSIGQFIRTFRLTLAREMLESGSGITVSEAAYEVGFNDPKYFTRCFTKEFGITPSAVSRA